MSERTTHTDITIIGTGNVARGIGARALAGGHSVTVLGSNAAALAEEVSGAVRAGAREDALSGDIVVLAVPYDAPDDIAAIYGDQLAGKVVVDITNPVDFSSFTPLAIEAGSAGRLLVVHPAGDRGRLGRAGARAEGARREGGQGVQHDVRRHAGRGAGRGPAARRPHRLRRRGRQARGPAARRGRRAPRRGRRPARPPASSRRSATCTWRCSSRSTRASRAR
jgi:hypothetical protein